MLKMVRYLGKSLIFISVIGLFLWVNSTDDLCLYSERVFMQIRLCSGYVEDQWGQPGHKQLLIILALMVLGILIVHLSSKD